MIDEFPDDMAGITKTPAASHLFMTNQECKKLPEQTVQVRFLNTLLCIILA